LSTYPSTYCLLYLLFVTIACTNNKPKSQDWFTVTYIDLCKENSHEDYETNVMKYERYAPFALHQKDSANFVCVSFDFIADCCLDFSGNAKTEKGNLKLLYWNTKKEPQCDCICQYRMHYVIDPKQAEWEKISIKLTQE